MRLRSLQMTALLVIVALGLSVLLVAYAEGKGNPGARRGCIE